MLKIIRKSFLLSFVGLLIPAAALAQASNGDINRRLEGVEEYIETIRPTLVEFTEKVQDNMGAYMNDLSNDLEDFSRRLQIDIENKISAIDKGKVVLNPASKAFQRIDTNAGSFLIAVEKLEKMTDGYRLRLQIGNPNYAEFSDVRLQLLWGKKWSPDSAVGYAQWRESLRGVQYTFPVKLEKGKWNRVEVELVPAETATIAHIECQMEVSNAILFP